MTPRRRRRVGRRRWRPEGPELVGDILRREFPELLDVGPERPVEQPLTVPVEAAVGQLQASGVEVAGE